jgi:hypothetical protein
MLGGLHIPLIAEKLYRRFLELEISPSHQLSSIAGAHTIS